MVVAKVYITLKKGILDPQGKAVKGALHSMGYEGVKDVRVGKYIELTFEDGDLSLLEQKVDEMCKKILTNPIIEDYTFEIGEG
ncbi:phosphoribosylformylglycinamidine synthase PurS [Thermoanaerobacter kivui]|uniref:Phosphoribosylformylglycinamidine synthase subunit PurS n=1 Tax=Thermoanaerobacter kivui TaxID=2325 RepID=A0A097APM3_THEKI|nr:phosphoribosylformylglycinamidine synthase subunit PurS [Thermoanaerobacter kivui]AIS51765.1 phosphoribosylformylglycinamidine synthase PurS [Thermoanaerobacter kivui]